MSGTVLHAADVDEAAAGWFLRRRSPDWSGEDARALDAWLDADPAHRASFADMAETWELAGRAAGGESLRAMRAQALAARPERRHAPWARIAAALAVVVLAGGGGWLALRDAGGGQGAAAPAQVYRTAVGERATITLVDGSSLRLNTNSEVAVDYLPGRRNLRLVSGEAWFDVAKDPSRPFVVSAKDHTVTAVGTSFDVRLEPAGLRVAVTEGRVAVDAARGRRLSEVKAGERMDVAGETAVVRPNTGPLAGDWRDGRIEFASVTLAEAVAEMNRYRTTPIVLADPAAGRLRVSGTFYSGEDSGFLDALPLTHPVFVKVTPNEIRVGSRPDKKSSPTG